MNKVYETETFSKLSEAFEKKGQEFLTVSY